MAATILGKRSRGTLKAEVPALPVRTSSKRRSRTPRILQEEDQSSVSSPRQLRSRGRKSSSIVEENDQENDTAEKSAPAAETKRSKHTVQPTTSPVKVNSHLRTTSKAVNDENANPIGIKTPSKSRYQDVLESPPITPRHRVQVGAKSLTPRTPRHISTPTTTTTTTTTTQTVYTQARQLFARGANSGRLIGRETEREKLRLFIEDGVESQTGGCLYVSGPPGTGKSAMIDEVCQEMDFSAVKTAHVNCASMRGPRDVYSKLVEEFCDDSEIFKKSEADRLKAMFIPNESEDGLFFVTLDEIDHLLTSDAGVLQSLFEWALHSKSKLMLIGVANALDLTDRSLPQLKAKNLKPRLLPFLPYNANQIANVITNRLRSLLPSDQNAEPNFVPFVQPAAIQLCAKKVASQTGDLRKAFELVKRAIDLIEQETSKKLEKQNDDPQTPSKTILIENKNLSTPAKTPQPKDSTSVYTALNAPRASIAHVARITSSAFGQGTVQRLQNINLQQKAVICSLIALDRKRREGDITSTPSRTKISAPTVKQIFDTYCALCRNDNILHPLTATEFKDVLSNLETMGLVGEFQGRGRGGTVAGGSDLRRTPSRSTTSTPIKGSDEQGLVCFVSQREIEGQIAGPGEGILRRLLSGQGL